MAADVPEGFNQDDLLGAQAITLLTSFLVQSARCCACALLVTVIAVFDRTIVAAVYTACALSVALQQCCIATARQSSHVPHATHTGINQMTCNYTEVQRVC